MEKLLEVTSNLCVFFMQATARLGNLGVGVITVVHYVFSFILMIIKMNEKLAFVVFKAMFPKFKNLRGVAYIPQRIYKEVDGLKVCHVTKDMMLNSMAQIHHGFELNAVNIIELCSDMVCYARLLQEDTIDSAKNFFKIVVLWLNSVRRIKNLCRLALEHTQANVTIAWTTSDFNNGVTEVVPVGCTHKCIKTAGVDGGVLVTKPVGNRWGNKGKKYFFDDPFNQLSNKLLDLTSGLAKVLSALKPEEIGDVLTNIETQAVQDRKFKVLCTVNRFWNVNAFRTLSSCMTQERKNAEKTSVGDELRATIRAINRTYAGLYADLSNMVRQVTDQFCADFGFNLNIYNRLKPALWASFREGQTDKRCKYNLASNFCDKILPEEFTLFMSAMARKKGYSVPEETQDRLITCKGYEDGDKAEFVLGVASDEGKRAKAMFQDTSLPDGEYTIRKTESGWVACRKIEDLIEIPEADTSRVTFVTSCTELGGSAMDAFCKLAVQGKDITLADYGFIDGEKKSNLILIDGQVISSFRSIVYLPKKSNETPDEEKFRKSVNDFANRVYARKQGQLASMKVGYAGNQKVAVVTLKNVKVVNLPKGRNFGIHSDVQLETPSQPLSHKDETGRIVIRK